MIRTIIASAAMLLTPSALSASIQLPNSLCGPPTDVIAALEARGFVNEFALTVVLPREVAGRSDVVLLAYFLDAEHAKNQSKRSFGYTGQTVAWILRTDAEPGKPQGWACLYKETKISEVDRQAMFARALQVDQAINATTP